MTRSRIAPLKMLGLSALLMAAACSDGGPSSPKKPAGPAPVASVVVSPAAVNVEVGKTTQMTAAVRDAAGNALSGRSISWASSNDALATVDGKGLVTGKAMGSVTITATVEGKAGSAPVTVTPVPVASIEVSPSTPSIEAGQTVQMVAILKDAAGNVLDLAGRTLTWSSADTTTATVSPTGLVTGKTAGTIAITATVEGKNGSTQVKVLRVSSVGVNSVQPNPLVEGQSATLTGRGFSPVAANNRVTIGGLEATVTTATENSLQITVPISDCQPARDAEVRVSIVNGDSSNPARYSVRPAEFLSVPVGQQTILKDPASFCLQLDQSSGAEAYLIGVQSTAEVVSSLTPVNLTAVAGPNAAGAASSSAAPLPSETRATGRAPADLRVTAADRRRAELWSRHDAAEAQLREWERTYLAPRMREAPLRFDRHGGVSTSLVPGNLQVGDTVPIRVPKRGPTFCTEFIPITSVVRKVGTHAIWLEDVANPAGGFTAADFEALSDFYDNQTYPVLLDYFGAPSDIDGNGRIVTVATQEVNKTPLGGFVSLADLVPRTTCASSNEGELFYHAVPDTAGTYGRKSQRSEIADAMKRLTAHEVTHIIQNSRRMALAPNFKWAAIWEKEGQARLAEEVVGHKVTGRTTGQNYGAAVAWNEPKTTDVSWYGPHFFGLAVYFGYTGKPEKAANAPEQCSWIDSPEKQPGTPCDQFELPYGGSWSLMRWVSDQFGPSYPGGEKALHKALIENRLSGFATLQQVVGVPIDTLLAQWSAMLYVDDRVPGANPRLTLPSWNLADIFGSRIEAVRLQPRERTFSSFADAVSVRGASTAYFRVSGANRPATAIRVRGAANAPLPEHMQVWIVRLQ